MTEYTFTVESDEPVYFSDKLMSLHRHMFMADPAFQRAYARGVKALGGEDKYFWHWRVHVGLWAAASAARLPGDFVECGVNYGFMSSAIMEYLDWDKLGKMFYLLDTFSGCDPQFLTAAGIEENKRKQDAGWYATSVEDVRANFSEWCNHRIIVGSIPDTLGQAITYRIAFLHIDLNSSAPEVAALRFFWPRLVPGALVLLDDYAYQGFGVSQLAMDVLAAELGVPIAALPTGQGLLIKN